MRYVLSWISLLSFTSLIAAPVLADLPAYVDRPDRTYKWTLEGQHTGNEGVVYRLHLISQVWKGVVWAHDLDVFVPKQLTTPATLLLFITGGERSQGVAAEVVRTAQSAGAPCAVLYGIPNQPLLDGLYEDDLIAKTFIQFLATGDPDWPLLLPMTKSVVKAMDALQAFSRRYLQHSLEGFVVTGASKRGWTSWLTAAVDQRVKGVVPRVFDMLNIPAQLPHQREAWGQYSEMLGPYTDPGLPAALSSGGGRRLIEMVDPYSYRTKLTAPKLIVLGTNDRYWSLDALDLYWSELPGTKQVLYVPNAGHGLAEAGWQDSLLCFFRHVAADEPLPQPAWQRTRDGDLLRLSVAGDSRPVSARLWYAQSPSRDFREARWRVQEVALGDGQFGDRRSGDGKFADGKFMAELHLSDDLSTAAFIEAQYDDALGSCRFASPIAIEPPRGSVK
jgi:PhoPQ-activated pathogenicity-related protein